MSCGTKQRVHREELDRLAAAAKLSATMTRASAARRHKNYFLRLLLCPAVSALAADQNNVVEKAVLETEHAWCRAFLHHNPDEIAAIESEDYTLTNSRGAISTRADDIAEAKTGAVHYTVFENHEMKVRLYGDAAVVTGRTLVKGRAGETSVDR